MRSKYLRLKPGRKTGKEHEVATGPLKLAPQLHPGQYAVLTAPQRIKAFIAGTGAGKRAVTGFLRYRVWG